MTDLLKNSFNEAFIRCYGALWARVLPTFDFELFLHKVFCENWESLELKQRLRQITHAVHDTIRLPYTDVLPFLKQVSDCILHDNITGYGLQFMTIPDYIEVYGLNYPDISIPALSYVTPSSSSEFAARPFLNHYPERMFQELLRCAIHENQHVRRYASESCRPRLPWAPVLPFLNKDPSPILPILDQLKTDASVYVQRSVANNLNDISKDHPQVVKPLFVTWYGSHPVTNWIVRHAGRTLLKNGDPTLLSLMGFEKPDGVMVSDFRVSPEIIRIGSSIVLNGTLIVSEPTRIRIEYEILYVKKRGNRNQKRFMISERWVTAGTVKIEKKCAFADLSTRKHYQGIHELRLYVNGEKKGAVEFELKP